MQAKSVRRSRLERTLAKMPTVLLIAAIGLAFLIGGGARSDILSLIVLRPLAALIFGFAVWRTHKCGLGHVRPLAVVFGLWLALPLFQLVPLPPAVWQALPGRALLASSEALLGHARWRPITLIPENTWNAFFSLLLPGAVFLLAGLVGRQRQDSLMFVMLIAGAASAVVAVIQSIGPHNGPFYFYEITNPEDAVGLFSNRNHQALFLACMFPMLAVLIDEARRRGGRISHANLLSYGAICVGLALFVLIVIAGSRAGLAFALIGILAGALMHSAAGRRGSERSVKKRALAILTGVIATIVALALFSTRATTLERFASLSIVEDLRFDVWGTVGEMAVTFFPFGSGLGTFAETYYMFEPEANFSLNYLNHAHNDWLEVTATGGLPALTLILAWLVITARRAWPLLARPLKEDVTGRLLYGRLGLAIIAMLLASSVVDYPLRVPALASLFIVANIWVWSSAEDGVDNRRDDRRRIK